MSAEAALAILGVLCYGLYRMAMAANRTRRQRMAMDFAERKAEREARKDRARAIHDLFRSKCTGCGGKFPDAALQFMGVVPDKPKQEIKLCADCRKAAGIGK